MQVRLTFSGLDGEHIEMVHGHTDLPGMLETYRRFLLAIGFFVKGEELVPLDSEDVVYSKAEHDELMVRLELAEAKDIPHIDLDNDEPLEIHND